MKLTKYPTQLLSSDLATAWISGFLQRLTILSNKIKMSTALLSYLTTVNRWPFSPRQKTALESNSGTLWTQCCYYRRYVSAFVCRYKYVLRLFEIHWHRKNLMVNRWGKPCPVYITQHMHHGINSGRVPLHLFADINTCCDYLKSTDTEKT